MKNAVLLFFCNCFGTIMSSMIIAIIILLFIGAAQGFLLSFALASLRRGNRTANRILSILLLFFSIMIAIHALHQLNTPAHQLKGGEEYGHTVFFLFGPLIFFYVKALTIQKFKFQINDVFHLAPFLSFMLFYYYSGTISHSGNFTHILNTLLPWFMVLQMSLYLIAALRLLKKFSHKIHSNFSSLEKINLNWLRFLMICQFIIWPISFLVEILKTDPVQVNIMWLTISIFIYSIGYFGIRQPEIFTGQLQYDEPVDQAERKKYLKSTLTDDQSDVILQRLAAYMQEKKPFLNSNLNLPILSEELSVSTHHLSQIINERIGQNFFEYVNKFRVEEAKRLLKDPRFQNFTLAAIGFEAGFNSVSSFNSIFKKHTSQTPSNYRCS